MYYVDGYLNYFLFVFINYWDEFFFILLLFFFVLNVFFGFKFLGVGFWGLVIGGIFFIKGNFGIGGGFGLGIGLGNGVYLFMGFVFLFLVFFWLIIVGGIGGGGGKCFNFFRGFGENLFIFGRWGKWIKCFVISEIGNVGYCCVVGNLWNCIIFDSLGIFL